MTQRIINRLLKDFYIAPEVNLIVNGDFENGDTGWSLFNDAAIDTGTGKGGTASMKLPPYTVAGFSRGDLPVENGVRYRFGFWAYAPEATSKLLYPTLGDNVEQEYYNDYIPFLTGGTWIYWSFEFDSLADNPLAISFSRVDDAAGNIYIDDMELVAIG